MRILVIIVLSAFLFRLPQKLVTTRIIGTAQGTTYHITYRSSEGLNYKREIDSVLSHLDTSLSTYISESIISRINRNDTGIKTDEDFTKVFKKSTEVSSRTAGAFDVTVAPLINAYGFGPEKKIMVDSNVIDSLLHFVGYKQVKLEGKRVIKSRPEIKLDFNAIAQGYSVDVLCDFLESKQINHYVVELGGEVRARGRNEKDEYWKVGIDQPKEQSSNENELQAIVSLKNKSLATSGNYKKSYVQNGKRFAHIIDPHTGYPAKHNLLSATVVAPDCMTADAYATAFMVMGIEKTKQFLAKNKGLKLEVFLIYDENGLFMTYASPGIRGVIVNIPQ